jgi:hypothetical protein
MQIKKIFLASSEELKEDRRDFALMLGPLNQQWRQRDITFDLVVWEYFVDAMTRDGLQKEYNKAVAGSDVFVMMFFTKVGRFTLEEFETAFAGMQASNGPRIYTYFRNDLLLTGDIDDGIRSLLDFKARLKALGHFVTVYRNAEDLQYHFSRQLELLYGEAGDAADDVRDSTSPFRAGEVALLQTYRHLYGGTPVDVSRMQAAIERSPRQARYTVLNMAIAMRRETWQSDKRLMERTIPVFEALVRSDGNWHGPIGQLGYALLDKLEPDWRRAKDCLDRAVELRGEDVGEGRFYQYNRARAAVKLDPAFTLGQPADPATRDKVLEAIRAARRELDVDWDELSRRPDSEPIRDWVQLNGSPRLR